MAAALARLARDSLGSPGSDKVAMTVKVDISGRIDTAAFSVV